MTINGNGNITVSGTGNKINGKRLSETEKMIDMKNFTV